MSQSHTDELKATSGVPSTAPTSASGTSVHQAPLQPPPRKSGKGAQIATWVVSLVVAISAAVEASSGPASAGGTADPRWSGSTSRAGSSFSSPGRTPPPTAATPTLSEPSLPAVEELIQKEVDAYITDAATEKHGSSDSG